MCRIRRFGGTSVRILVVGDKGQLGNELKDVLALGKSELGAVPAAYDGADVTGIDIDALDIADADAVRSDFTCGERPGVGVHAEVERVGEVDGAYDIIINCAAMTNVDTCEADAESAMRANAIGARNLAAAARRIGAKFVHLSTDYVFDGCADAPYREWDATAPATVYGKSKLLGERYATQACRETFIVRTSWLYGRVGNNFVKTILGLARDRDSIKVVDDQMGNPTHANDLAHHILKIALTEEYGVYHCTGEGVCSWYDFATEIVRLSDLDCDVTACTTEEFPRPAPRPAYSAMDHLMLRCTVGDEMREWREAIASFIVRCCSIE
jgi:dTDP-4-dehydrorhamnose reductase